MREEVNVINGIEFCSALNRNLNSFCLALYARAGSIFEDASNNGISHLLEHVVFRNLKSNFPWHRRRYHRVAANQFDGAYAPGG